MIIYLIAANQGIPPIILKITTITDEITIISIAQLALLKFFKYSCKKNIADINVIIVNILIGLFKFDELVINPDIIKIINKMIETEKKAS